MNNPRKPGEFRIYQGGGMMPSAGISLPGLANSGGGSPLQGPANLLMDFAKQDKWKQMLADSLRNPVTPGAPSQLTPGAPVIGGGFLDKIFPKIF